MYTEFRWDEAKREGNLRKHGFDFQDAWQVFAGPTLTFGDDRFHYTEERLVTIGFLGGRVVTVVHTESARVIRVISLRKATQNEQATFLSQFQN